MIRVLRSTTPDVILITLLGKRNTRKKCFLDLEPHRKKPYLIITLNRDVYACITRKIFWEPANLHKNNWAYNLELKETRETSTKHTIKTYPQIVTFFIHKNPKINRNDFLSTFQYVYYYLVLDRSFLLNCILTGTNNVRFTQSFHKNRH